MDLQMPERLRPGMMTQDTKPYWDGLKDGRILLQKCKDCGTVRHYPRPVCPDCYSLNVSWIEAEGSGTVHSWSTSHHPFHPAFKKDLPTVYVTIDLPEGVRLCATLREATADDLQLNTKVRVGVEQIDDDLALPICRLE